MNRIKLPNSLHWLFRSRLLNSRFVRFYRRLWQWQPLTWRGVLALILATVALRMYAISDYDLVADVLGVGTLALLVLALLSACLLRLKLGQQLAVEAHFDRTSALARREIPAGLTAKGSSLPPFFTLRLKRRFVHPGPFDAVHIIKNRSPEDGQRHLLDTVVFPHRGYWRLESVDCQLQDALGLVSFGWSVPMESGIEVAAETIAIQPLPIVAASARSGDQISKSTERAGDLFDLKQYDPSDGIKRILWKVYAKSGQLIVRRPEPAVIPEGEVALYLVASAEEDYVAGATQSYLDQLEAAQITVLFGTDGLAEFGEAGNLGFVTSRDEMHEAINRCVWSNDAGSGRGFAGYIAALERGNRSVSNVIVFGAAESAWLQEIAPIAIRHSIRLTLAAVPKELDPEESLVRFQKRIRTAELQKVIEATPSPLKEPLAWVLRASGRLPSRTSLAAGSNLASLPALHQTPNCDVHLVHSTEIRP